ncbi:hypothetical protein HDU85_005235 [Gaertneriomyces sp. JEL0708]|nr:hypothetical protein HDU85_005235 [Gaertneriomyces sp. JEL0708]
MLSSRVPRSLTLPLRHYRQCKRTFLTRPRTPAIICNSAEEAVSHVKDHSRIYIHGVACTPTVLLNALAKRASELSNVEFNHLHLEEVNPCMETGSDGFYTNHFFIGANARKSVAEGRGSYIPTFLHEVPKLMRTGLLKPDVALLNLSPPDKHGYCSLGAETAAAYAAAETAETIIAQINPNMPRTHGQTSIHIDDIDYAINVDVPISMSHAPKEPTPVETAIGKHIAELVPDGATLQMGIGAIPNAVLKQLTHHKNLGVHTEMFAEGLIDLMEQGVVTNFEKKYLRGKLVTSFVLGGPRVYNFVDDNPTVYFLDAAITNNPTIIGTNPKVTAINSALEVDLTGQVCADSVGFRMISGVGGQVDFERGAALSQGGVPIICLPSTTKDGKSKIVPAISYGAGVITTRHHVHWVVTEFGATYLFGKSLVQRAKALIDIAHPDHREELERIAFERFNIKTWELGLKGKKVNAAFARDKLGTSERLDVGR